MESLTNNSIKEYYVKLLNLYNNAVNMITALNQSLNSSSAEINVSLVGDDDTETTLRIPSMLYLENKLEQLDNNFNNLFNMPASGEAWFHRSSDMFKLQMVKAATAPLTPKFNTRDVVASITNNNFLRDLVSPKTFLKLNVTNLPENIEQMFVRKIIFNNLTLFNTLQQGNYQTYDEYVGALYNLTKNVDYEIYDTVIDLPLRHDKYASEFKIVDIPKLEYGNPWVDATDKYNDGHSHLSYKLILNTLTFNNIEDGSIWYTLKPGDYICLDNKLAIYKVKTVNVSEMSVIIEEVVGHVTLQKFEDNNSIVFRYYNEDYADFKYVQVPIEENQYIALFLGTIQNNTRSLFSAPYIVDLSTIYMYDENNNKILDKNGNHLKYTEYYDMYCTNIGDILTGLTQTIYPQISNYDNVILNDLQSSEVIRVFVNNSVNSTDILKVVPINKHVSEGVTKDNIISLNAQKAELTAQLTALQQNIDTVNNTLSTSDFTQETVSSQTMLQTQLKDYYSQRTTLQTQLNNVINNLSIANASTTTYKKDMKYHIRGVLETYELESHLKTLGDKKLNVIGIDVEYKYKSVSKETTDITAINSNIFTDWNKYTSIDKERYLFFNDTLSSFDIDYIDYSSLKNIIKWNQIDIPISQGEDVVIRVRYKYNVGQPFINIYTPWSDEITVGFPAEYSETNEIATILAANEEDVTTAKFTQLLINKGYEEHVTNSVTMNNNKFFHMPENIYSGFNTSSNEYISLKDKLASMDSILNETKDKIDSELNKKYKVYLQHDGNYTELSANSINKINIYNTDHSVDSFVKNMMNIVIKNVGDVSVRFYSIFPGNVDIPLLLDEEEFYEKYIVNYERVPLFIGNELSYQTLGQWIYFRQNNPYTTKCIYYNSMSQNTQDYNSLVNNNDKVTFTSTNNYIKQNYNQVLLGYRKRSNDNTVSNINTTKIMGLQYDKYTNSFVQLIGSDAVIDTQSSIMSYVDKEVDFFIYKKDTTNNYLGRFEDICGVDKDNKIVYLDYEASMSQFIANNSVSGVGSNGMFVGAFLFPDLESRNDILTTGGYADFVEIPTSKSLSIPVTFEYYIDGEETSKITKALYFDLRDSLVENPQHYMIELTANYDYTATGSLINNVSLIDDATNL